MSFSTKHRHLYHYTFYSSGSAITVRNRLLTEEMLPKDGVRVVGNQTWKKLIVACDGTTPVWDEAYVVQDHCIIILFY